MGATPLSMSCGWIRPAHGSRYAPRVVVLIRSPTFSLTPWNSSPVSLVPQAQAYCVTQGGNLAWANSISTLNYLTAIAHPDTPTWIGGKFGVRALGGSSQGLRFCNTVLVSCQLTAVSIVVLPYFGRQRQPWPHIECADGWRWVHSGLPLGPALSNDTCLELDHNDSQPPASGNVAGHDDCLSISSESPFPSLSHPASSSPADKPAFSPAATPCPLPALHQHRSTPPSVHPASGAHPL